MKDGFIAASFLTKTYIPTLHMPYSTDNVHLPCKGQGVNDFLETSSIIDNI